MKIKYFNYPLTSNENITIQNPNFSIVTPGGCNANCNFCFWKKTTPCKGYFEKLSNILNNLPEQFNKISITGGEPTISPYLEKILFLIDKYRYPKVVLTTNGFNLLNVYEKFENIVDHVNISRHHYLDNINDNIFNSSMPKEKDLKLMTEKLNNIGIDVTFSAVLNKDLKTEKDIKSYIDFAKKNGASKIFFRKPHGDLSPSITESIYENIKYREHVCPVCRDRNQLIEGMNITWKSSLVEPSIELDAIYELIFNENGKLTKDWKGLYEVDINKQFVEKINESSCGYGFYSCGNDTFFSHSSSSETPNKVSKNNLENNDDENHLIFIYNKLNKLKVGDDVIYNKNGHKYKGVEFKIIEIRSDGKLKLENDNLIFIVFSNNVIKKNNNFDMIKFKKIIKNLIDEGIIDKKVADKFIIKKTIDPFNEEDWS